MISLIAAIDRLGRHGWALLAEVEAGGQPRLWDRLDPVMRARLLMTLLGLIILVLGMAVLIAMGGRWVRRLSRATHRTPAARPWYEPRPSHRLPEEAQEMSSGIPERPTSDEGPASDDEPDSHPDDDATNDDRPN